MEEAVETWVARLSRSMISTWTRVACTMLTSDLPSETDKTHCAEAPLRLHEYAIGWRVIPDHEIAFGNNVKLLSSAKKTRASVWHGTRFQTTCSWWFSRLGAAETGDFWWPLSFCSAHVECSRKLLLSVQRVWCELWNTTTFTKGMN